MFTEEEQEEIQFWLAATREAMDQLPAGLEPHYIQVGERIFWLLSGKGIKDSPALLTKAYGEVRIFKMQAEGTAVIARTK